MTLSLPFLKTLIQVRLSMCATNYQRYKGRNVSVQAMETYRGSSGIDPFILNLCTTWRWIFTLMPFPIFCQEERCYALSMSLGGFQRRF